ncbi:hypothetical protein Avbf_10436 [Armadillidium vulgare]|nr:hypothetical protein Avbf_10436 [Armadillidium vulgare]
MHLVMLMKMAMTDFGFEFVSKETKLKMIIIFFHLETYPTTVRYFAYRGRSFHEHIVNMTLLAQPLDSNVDDGSANVNLKRQL